MSDKKPGLGLFINKKDAGAPSAAPVAPSAGGKRKDVKKRWMIVGLIAIGTVAIGSSLMAPEQKAPVPVKKKSVADNMISVEPPKANDAVLESKFSQDMAQMKARLQDMDAKMTAKDTELEQLRQQRDKQVPTGIVAPPSMNAGSLPPLNAAPVLPPVQPLTTTTKPSVGANANPGLLPPPINTTKSAAIPAASDIPELPAASSGGALVFDAPGAAGASAGSAASGASSAGPNVAVKETYKKNTMAGLLPAGAFAPVALLNGLDAGTSSATQSNPMPVLMNILDQATLPGAAKYKLKNCFVLGTGYGDLSAERVYIRFSRLSCVDKNDRVMLSQDVAGYVVDSDGKLGLRGRINDRQGAKLGLATLSGFAQGLAGALGQSQSTVSSNLSTGSTMSAMTGTQAMRASGLSGAQVAASQLAQFYLKEAESIFPVISVDTGRTATVVFTNSVSLNWGSAETQFVKELKPTN